MFEDLVEKNDDKDDVLIFRISKKVINELIACHGIETAITGFAEFAYAEFASKVRQLARNNCKKDIDYYEKIRHKIHEDYYEKI